MGVTGQGAGNEMLNIGQRLQSLRKDRHLSQGKLAKMVGTSPSQISLIESSKSLPSLKTAVAIARAMDTSLDYLTGAVEDPRRTSALLRKLRYQNATLFDQTSTRSVREDETWKDYLSISEVDGAAGVGGVIHEDRVRGRMKFPALWLYQEGLRAPTCRIIRVVGESMEPTLQDGCSILINLAKRELEHGKIFVIQTEDHGAIVSRTVLDKEEGWLLTSDNPNKQTWPTRPWPDGATAIREVRWTWYSLP